MTDIILDAHFDVLLDVLYFRQRGETRVLETKHLPILRSAGINAVVCSIFVKDELLPEGALRNALDLISALYDDVAESQQYFSVCKTAEEAEAAVEGGRIALFLSLEGADPIGSDIFLLKIFYDLGVRLLGLTWSRRNYAADGCPLEASDGLGSQGGLTKFGRDVVMKAQQLGMLIDVSHLNDRGFYEVAEIMELPFIASHSNCRALCDVPRNLTDDQLGTIAHSGGIIGINAYEPFTSLIPAERTPQRLFEHLVHLTDVVGAQHAGLGLDICESLKSFRLDAGLGDIFRDHADAAKNFIAPIRERFSPEDSAAILGGNFMRVIKQVVG